MNTLLWKKRSLRQWREKSDAWRLRWPWMQQWADSVIAVSPSASWTQQVCSIGADSAISAIASEQCQMYPSRWILHLILWKPYCKQKLD